jgi:4-amino-4-deoxy-L-arabinose transferase-like glycosyltransferase
VRWWPLALLALAVAFAWPMQVNGWNQNAHYALTRALGVHGTPHIDRSRREIGDLGTGDVGFYHGHWYAAKAPALGFLSVPALLVLEELGMRTTGDPTRVIWALHLMGVALAGVVLLVLVRGIAERLEPGLGTAAAVTLGVATLVLPFATLFFSHVLAALLGFAAFALLASERDRPERLGLVIAAGVSAGLAVFAEYPLAIAGAILGLYAIARPGRLRRGVAYSGGVLVGLLPLLLFNWWAFGTPTHIAYEDYYAGGERAGVFGFGLPSLSHAHDLLLQTMGLLVLTPVVVAGLGGGFLMLRRRRAEALVLLGVVGAYFLYNVSLRYASPFGGLGPPRYLFTMLPFLGVAFAVAYRRFPLTTLGLGLVSAFQMVLMTATGPLAAYDGEWLSRAGSRVFVQTGAAIVEVTGWYGIFPFFAAVVVAATAAALATGRVQATGPDALAAGVSVGAWALVALAAENPNGTPPGTAYVLAITVASLALVAVVAVALAARATIQPVTPSPSRKSTAEQTGQV